MPAPSHDLGALLRLTRVLEEIAASSSAERRGREVDANTVNAETTDKSTPGSQQGTSDGATRKVA